LVSEAQLRLATERLTEQGIATDDSDLAAELVRTNVISQYQAEQLLAGRTKFTLGPYVITDWLGQGGMGQVFKGHHELMGRDVAIKVLPQDKSTPEAIASFTREIRTQAQLDHAHLVRAFDAGQEGKVYFLVTEYVPGTDLRRLVRLEGRLSMAQAANIICQVALGLDHAHRQGLIHRDIKPGNILVTPRGEAKLSDLGLAGFLHEGNNDPRAGRIVGTADYLSPEQIREPGKITSSSEIYSLGCTLYYAVTAKVPFPGGRTKDKVRRHLEEMPWHPRRINPEISEELVDVIADMMEKDCQRRIQTAAEVARRLEPWAAENYVLPAHDLQRSPWQAAPLPTGVHDTADEVDIEESGSESLSESPSQVSEGTYPLSAAGEETRALPDSGPAQPAVSVVADRLKKRRSPSRLTLIMAVIIPLAMLLGALITLLVLALIG
jgi:serine/threonine protein kinase